MPLLHIYKRSDVVWAMCKGKFVPLIPGSLPLATSLALERTASGGT